MGADMTIATLAVQEGTELDWYAAELMVEDMSEDDLEQIADFFDLEQEQVRTRLRQAVEAVHGAIEGCHRECTLLSICDWTVYLTGGLSTGDAPTDLFDAFWLVTESGLADAIGFAWPSTPGHATA